MTIPLKIEIPIQVRYVECDAIGIAHHSAYPVWMEIARTELLKIQSVPYKVLEAQGIYFVVAKLSIRYRKPAHYDENLRVVCTMPPGSGVKIEHEYEIYRGETLLTEGSTTLVCVDGDGRPRTLPGALLGC